MPTCFLDRQQLVTLDVDRLVYTKLLAVANSGGGKGWFLRRLLEQTFGQVLHFVIDPEGEFHTLRERHPYMLIGPGGEAPATVKDAAKLAPRLLRKGWSAILDLSELPVTEEADQRTVFVREFLRGLMAVKREGWRETLVVIDEAQIFAPEKGAGEAVSTSAVIDLMTRGRKRGFCGVLATQRISQLHKSAAAECNNRLIGRTALDIDQQRAAKAIGLKANQQTEQELRELGDGEFFAWGPAISGSSKGVLRMTVGQTHTTHLRVGRRAPLPVGASGDMASAFQDFVAELEAEPSSDVEALRARVRELESKIADGPHPNEFQSALEEAQRDVKMLTETIEHMVNELRGISDRASEASNYYLDQTTTDDEGRPNAVIEAPPPSPIANPSPSGELPAMHRAFLVALAHRGPLSKSQILLYAGYAQGGATSRAFAHLAKVGYVRARQAGDLMITDLGRIAIRCEDPLPSGNALLKRIADTLDPMPRKFFETAIARGSAMISKAEILKITGYAQGGATSRAFAHLVSRNYLVRTASGHVRANPDLFR